MQPKPQHITVVGNRALFIIELKDVLSCLYSFVQGKEIPKSAWNKALDYEALKQVMIKWCPCFIQLHDEWYDVKYNHPEVTDISLHVILPYGTEWKTIIELNNNDIEW